MQRKLNCTLYRTSHTELSFLDFILYVKLVSPIIQGMLLAFMRRYFGIRLNTLDFTRKTFDVGYLWNCWNADMKSGLVCFQSFDIFIFLHYNDEWMVLSGLNDLNVLATSLWPSKFGKIIIHIVFKEASSYLSTGNSSSLSLKHFLEYLWNCSKSPNRWRVLPIAIDGKPLGLSLFAALNDLFGFIVFVLKMEEVILTCKQIFNSSIRNWTIVDKRVWFHRFSPVLVEYSDSKAFCKVYFSLNAAMQSSAAGIDESLMLEISDLVVVSMVA